jgi:hypothetical protein
MQSSLPVPNYDYGSYDWQSAFPAASSPSPSLLSKQYIAATSICDTHYWIFKIRVIKLLTNTQQYTTPSACRLQMYLLTTYKRSVGLRFCLA